MPAECPRVYFGYLILQEPLDACRSSWDEERNDTSPDSKLSVSGSSINLTDAPPVVRLCKS